MWWSIWVSDVTRMSLPNVDSVWLQYMMDVAMTQLTVHCVFSTCVDWVSDVTGISSYTSTCLQCMWWLSQWCNRDVATQPDPDSMRLQYMCWLSQWCDRDIATQPLRVHCVFSRCVDWLSLICDRDYATPQSPYVFSASLSQWWISLPNQCPCVVSACVDWVRCKRERIVTITDHFYNSKCRYGPARESSKWVSNLVFYAQSTITAISGRYTFCWYTISVKNMSTTIASSPDVECSARQTRWVWRWPQRARTI